MPKHPVTCDDRAAEFRSEGFIVASSSGNLFCKHCNFCLDYKRKDSLQKHCKSQIHIARKSGNITAVRLATLEETLDSVWKVEDQTLVKDLPKEEFILDTVEAFIDANIPVEKLDHSAMRAWMSKYVRGSRHLPLADWLVQHYIPVVGERKRQEIQADLKDNDIFLLCNETTDKNGSCVFNVLIRPSTVANCANTHLAESVVLDFANSANCADAVLDTLVKYSINSQRVVGIVTDSTKYMTECVQTVKELIDNIQHMQCWVQKAGNIGRVFEDELDELNTAVKVKHTFLHTRKSSYVQFLSEKYQGSNPEMISLFPSPVCTRWNSWFKSVWYLSNHMEDVVEFFRSLDDGNADVKFFNAASSATIQTIKVQAIYVSDVCRPLMDLITFLEGSSSCPTIHTLAGKLSDIEIKFSLFTEGVFSERTVCECQRLSNEAKTTVQAKLKTAAKSALEMLQQLRSQDPAMNIIESVGALFDPRNAPKKKSVLELTALQMIVPFIKDVQKLHFLEGHTAFLDAVKEQLKGEHCVSVDVQGILNGLKLSHREYACAALRAIWTPCSTVASERSFSKYSLVVSDRRRRVTAANAEALTMVAFE